MWLLFVWCLISISLTGDNNGPLCSVTNDKKINQEHSSARAAVNKQKRGSKGRGGRTRVVRSYLYSNIYSLVQELHARRRVRNNNSKHSSFVRSWGISRYSRLFLELIKITWRNSGGSDSWTCPAAKPTRTASRKRGWKNNNNNEVH